MSSIIGTDTEYEESTIFFVNQLLCLKHNKVWSCGVYNSDFYEKDYKGYHYDFILICITCEYQQVIKKRE